MQRNYPLETYLPNVSRLSFGCMGLGRPHGGPLTKANHAEAMAATEAALEAGINLFDHADIYNGGKAEQVFGQVLAERPNLRENIYIQSKCGIRLQDEKAQTRYDFSREWILASVDGSLSRLGVDYLDVLLLHRPDPLMEAEEVAEAFERLRNSGKVRHFGVSNMHGPQLSFLQSYLDVPLVANQIEVSLGQLGWVDEGILAGNPEGSDVNFTPGTLEYCCKNAVQLQAWGSLAQGVFSGREAVSSDSSVEKTALLVASYAEQYAVSREAIVLAWLMRHPANIQPIIGTTNPERILACSEATKVVLTREEWYELFVSARGKPVP